ncbi:MAG: radical SAM protein [Chloroflexi bacterium]|nr:radical SAM protein [Chloroflexota bacterium]
MATLARHLLANPANTGLTFSGGEPMCQTSALAKLVEYVRRIRDIDIICYTEYTMSQLRTAPPVLVSFSTSRPFRMMICMPLSPGWPVKMDTR